MTYTLVPNSGQSLGQTRDPIRTNFSTIQTAFNVDHVNFDATGEGKHAKVTLPEGSAPTVALNDVVMYAKDTNGRPTIFMRQENNGSEIQLSGPTPSIGANGYTFLPGGLLLQWGVNGTNSPSISITFPTAFTTLYSITLGTRGGISSQNPFKISAESASGFTAITNTSNSGFFWMAIGTI